MSEGPDSRKRVFVETINDDSDEALFPPQKRPRFSQISLLAIAAKVDRRAIRAQCEKEIPQERWESAEFEELFIKKWEQGVKELFKPLVNDIVKNSAIKDGYMGCKVIHFPSKISIQVLSGFNLGCKFGPSVFREKEGTKKEENKKDPNITFSFEYPYGSVNQLFDDVLFDALTEVVYKKGLKDALGIVDDDDYTVANVRTKFGGGKGLYAPRGMNKSGGFDEDTAQFTTPFKAEMIYGTKNIDPSSLKGMRIYKGIPTTVTDEDGTERKVTDIIDSSAEELCAYYKMEEGTRVTWNVPKFRILWRLIQATAVPGRKSWSVKRQVDSIIFFPPTGDEVVRQDPGLDVNGSQFDDGFDASDEFV